MPGLKKDKFKKEVAAAAAASEMDDVECPLCMEKLDDDELCFYPCSCSFQICRFCWHRIKDNSNGLCPACRQPYSENPVAFCPVIPTKPPPSVERPVREKKKKDKKELIEERKKFVGFRVIQRNLVYVVGLPPPAATEKNLRNIFEKYGKISSLIIGTLPSNFCDEPLNTAYITFSSEDEAVQAIYANINLRVADHPVKVTLGTTKYCQSFFKAEPCTRAECSYLHEIAPREISFTREDMQQGKHIEYEKELINKKMLEKKKKNLISSTLSSSTTPSSTAAAAVSAATMNFQKKMELLRKEWEKQKAELIEARKFLASYRVIQKNLVYVVGIPSTYATEADLKNIFEPFGTITNLIIGTLPSSFGDERLNTAYITFSCNEEAIRAIFANSRLRLGDRHVKVTLGTTKYCQQFLKAENCTRVDCSYLHEIAPADISFTKEDMQQQKHIEYEKNLIYEMYREKIY